MNVNTIFKLLPAVVLSVITMESCQNMDKNENTKEEKNAIEIIMARKSVRSYTSRPVEKEKVEHHAESCYGGSLGCKQATLGFYRDR